MRKLKLQVQVTVDGYMGGPNGELDFMTWNWDDELKAYANALNDPIGTILLGRKMANGFITHWAAITDKNNPEYPFAQKMTNTPKVVFTKTLKKSEWEHNTSIATGDLTDEVNKLKSQPGGDIIVYGGSNFVSNLIKHNLIDDFHLFVNPISLAKGIPVFASSNTLKLVEAKPFPCGVSVLHYRNK